ncbi:Protein ral2 [Fusarium oxysporum f. sp. albedinis]|nr:Protein ral2 [Fusarium oxysporum f. sp. albedinis]
MMEFGKTFTKSVDFLRPTHPMISVRSLGCAVSGVVTARHATTIMSWPSSKVLPAPSSQSEESSGSWTSES